MTERLALRPAWLAWGLWASAMLGLSTAVLLDQLLRHAGRPDLASLDADGLPYLLALLSATTVGTVLASRRPAHPVGWLLLALGLLTTSSGVAEGYARYGLLARPGALPADGALALYDSNVFVVWPALIGFILLLTPTGSLPSPRWRWWARAAAAAPVVFLLAAMFGTRPLDPPYPPLQSPLAMPAVAGPLNLAGGLALAVSGLSVLVAAGSLLARFRRASGVERQQLRWVAFAAGLAGVAVLGVLAGMAARSPAVYVWATGLYVAALPLVIGAAIARYRLYDLDRIISRTVAYGLLTVLLGAGYAGMVVLLAQLVGHRSSLAVAGATLAVAGAFQPARHRVQQAVDRRFNRRRADAVHTITAFSARLRQQVDLDTLTAELLAVVDQTMQPTRASLWLRPRRP